MESRCNAPGSVCDGDEIVFDRTSVPLSVLTVKNQFSGGDGSLPYGNGCEFARSDSGSDGSPLGGRTSLVRSWRTILLGKVQEHAGMVGSDFVRIGPESDGSPLD